jgi:aminoglycoside phosphotransferase (APT) family kinase protein
VKEALAERLGSEVVSLRQLAGGASKEAWAVDLADGRSLLVRRAGVGVIHRDTLTLEQEFRVLGAAVEAGVRAPRPVAYLGEIEGREAFAMERVEGETIGRRIARDPPPGLALELADELARIHSIEPLDFLPRGDAIARFYEELDSVGEPHPAIEYGLAWVRERLESTREPTFVHGDFRVGNLAVTDRLVAVLDWEFAHVGDPIEDVAWPIVRAWRFGADDRRLGGVGDVEPYLERYNGLTGRGITLDELLVLEVFGNVKWAIGCLTQSRRHLNGQDRSVEYAVLGRMAAEMEYELLDLIARATSSREQSSRPAVSRDQVPGHGHGPGPDRPDASELVEAVFEFLADEVLPNAPDQRARFRTLVAMNALSIARRELGSDERFPSEDELRELARRIREGSDADPAELRAHVAAKLRISNPAYLAKYE